MHTEQRAKELWCPFTRVGEQASGAAENRPDGSYNCIASQCSQWRWQTVAEADEENRAWVEANDDTCPMPIRMKGYCGLAGKPEA